MQSVFGNKVHLQAKQIFEGVFQCDVVNQTSITVQAHKQVNIAAFDGVSSDNRSEYPQTMSAMRINYTQYLIPPCLHIRHCYHRMIIAWITSAAIELSTPAQADKSPEDIKKSGLRLLLIPQPTVD